MEKTQAQAFILLAGTAASFGYWQHSIAAGLLVVFGVPMFTAIAHEVAKGIKGTKVTINNNGVTA